MRMTSLAVILCLFLAVPTAVCSTTCLQCTNVNGKTCEGKPVTCDGDRKCFVRSNFLHYLGEDSSSITKGCVTENIPCDYVGYLDIGGANSSTYSMNIKCCDGDNCNTFGHEIPEENEKFEGKTCPTCVKLNSNEECVPETDMVCRGKDDLCYTYVGTWRDEVGNEIHSSEKGCLETFLCKELFGLATGMEAVQTTTFTCT
ncbi:Hypothetical predicted protein [Pelobates cultripes]|uniref:UPAR/Ly6 domain-containing protein n=1 Tax=Pelobates cultripes TaxID=61616 RepID=A0AAD1T896_PELCU|nr:Hypothetical predicted protein [Pelobates cultripes]